VTNQSEPRGTFSDISNISDIAGIDEAGRGPLAGPVVAAAVLLDPKNPIEGLADSKILDEPARERLYQKIRQKALGVGVARVEAQRIDAINILQATLEAMARALRNLERGLGKKVMGALVDGNKVPPLPARVRAEAIVRGDSLVPAIMAASIVAKVTRDRRMRREDHRHPGYGFSRHKGYGTAAHLAALDTLGPSPIHRLTFAPVRRAFERGQGG
jgi:ribonuclease HII